MVNVGGNFVFGTKFGRLGSEDGHGVASFQISMDNVRMIGHRNVVMMTSVEITS
jgi:hypothetical protein